MATEVIEKPQDSPEPEKVEEKPKEEEPKKVVEKKKKLPSFLEEPEKVEEKPKEEEPKKVVEKKKKLPSFLEEEEKKRVERERRRRERKRKRKQMLLKFTTSRKNELLQEYFSVIEGRVKPKFKRMRETGELNKKVKEVYEILEHCELCERKCGVNRMKGEKGFCGSGDKPEMFVSFSHHGDEDFLVPSYTVFFMGCNMKCQFCQNFQISQRIEKGKCQYCGENEDFRKTCNTCKKRKNQNVKDIEEVIDKNVSKCRTLQFIGGEPTPNLPFIMDTLKSLESDVPTIWKSNFYFSEKSFNLLSGVVDIWLSDWKFGNNECAERLSKTPNYWEVVKRNHDLAVKDDSVLIIRHLVMPNHVECCSIPILKYIAETYGRDCIVNIMDQYQPCWHATEMKDIRGIPSRRELKRLYKYADELNLVWITH